MKENSVYCAESRAAMKGHWTNLVITSLVMLLVTMVVSGVATLIPVVGSLLSYCITLPISWAFTVIFLKWLRTREDVQFGELFTPFTNKDEYVRIFVTMLLQVVYTFLWALLLIVPGVIKSYSYAMTPFILKDDPEMKNNEAIEKSMAMMEGHKMQLFLLDLRFFGWTILAMCFTLCIGLLWVLPYQSVARAAFYEDLKAEFEPAAAPQEEAPKAEVAE